MQGEIKTPPIHHFNCSRFSKLVAVMEQKTLRYNRGDFTCNSILKPSNNDTYCTPVIVSPLFKSTHIFTWRSLNIFAFVGADSALAIHFMDVFLCQGYKRILTVRKQHWTFSDAKYVLFYSILPEQIQTTSVLHHLSSHSGFCNWFQVTWLQRGI